MKKEFNLFEIMDETNKNKKLLKSLNRIRYKFYEDNFILKLEAQQKDEHFEVSDKLNQIYLLDNPSKIHEQLSQWINNGSNIRNITDEDWLIQYVDTNVKPGEFIIQYYQVNWSVYERYKAGELKLDDKIPIVGYNEEYYVADLLFFINTLIANIDYFQDYLLSLYN